MTGPMLVLAVTTGLFAAAVQAPPAIVNGQVVERPVAADLAATVRAIGAERPDGAWVGYPVPAARTDDDWQGGWCGVTLESGSGSRLNRRGRAVVALDPPATLIVLARVEQGQVVRLRSFPADCRIDAGGGVVHWLNGVRPRDSVTWLAAFASDGEARKLSDGAMSAIALHDESTALDWLLSAARSSASAHTRGQALFWLAQRAGQKAVGAIAEAIARDPDTDVKKRAVFALSQLPDGEGVPKLIEVARGHSNKAVQKQAFFWLGQSKDPRALAFFREVLR